MPTHLRCHSNHSGWGRGSLLLIATTTNADGKNRLYVKNHTTWPSKCEVFFKNYRTSRRSAVSFVVLGVGNEPYFQPDLTAAHGAFLSEVAQFCRVLYVLNSFSEKKRLFPFIFQKVINFCRRRCTEKCRRCTGCRRRCTEKRRRKTVLVTLLRTNIEVGDHLFCRRRCTDSLPKFCRR